MKTNKYVTSGVLVLAVVGSSMIYAAKKSIGGPGVVDFPESPSVENLHVDATTKKVKKVNDVCVGAFATAFIQNSVVQIRARTLTGSGKMRAAAGRRLINVEEETRQAITDAGYAYAREALAKAGFNVKSETECAALKGWDDFKTTDKANGKLEELGIFSGTMAIPTGATHAARHAPTGQPPYKGFNVSPLGDVTNNMVKGMQFAKKHKVGLVDFEFALDYNVNSAEAEVTVSSSTSGNIITTTTSKSWEFDFVDALFVSSSVATYVDPNFKLAGWRTSPGDEPFPAIKENGYITGMEENNQVWDKRINAVNFDLTIDQEKYKENYIKILKAYIDVYVAQMAALPV